MYRCNGGDGDIALGVSIQKIDTRHCIAPQREPLSSSPISESHNIKTLKKVTNTKNIVQRINEDNTNVSVEASENQDLKYSAVLARKAFQCLPGEKTAESLQLVEEDGYKEIPANSSKAVEAGRCKSLPITDDLTQNSSVSPTQENPISAYLHLLPERSYEQLLVNNKSYTYLENSQSPTTCALFPDQNISKRPDDTLHLEFHQCGSRYLKLDSKSESEDLKVKMNQEAISHVVDQSILIESPQRFEPQTPALQTNPFQFKGSVMLREDLFLATQSSCANRHDNSPIISRPSPEIYEDFSSPTKRQRLSTSPSIEFNRSSMFTKPGKILQQENVLDQHQHELSCAKGILSGDVNPKNSNSESTPTHGLRYKALANENQKRRKANLGACTSEESDTQVERISTQRIQKNRKKTLQKTSNVEMRRSFSSDHLEPLESAKIGTTTKKYALILPLKRSEQLATCSPRTRRHSSSPDDCHTLVQNNNIRYSRFSPADATSFESNIKEQYGTGSELHNQRIEKQKEKPYPCSTPNKNTQSSLPPLRADIPIKPFDSCEYFPPSLQVPIISSNPHDSQIAANQILHTNSDNPETVPETSPVSQRHSNINEVVDISLEKAEVVSDSIRDMYKDVGLDGKFGLDSSQDLSSLVPKKENTTASNVLSKTNATPISQETLAKQKKILAAKDSEYFAGADKLMKFYNGAKTIMKSRAQSTIEDNSSLEDKPTSSRLGISDSQSHNLEKVYTTTSQGSRENSAGQIVMTENHTTGHQKVKKNRSPDKIIEQEKKADAKDTACRENEYDTTNHDVLEISKEPPSGPLSPNPKASLRARSGKNRSSTWKQTSLGPSSESNKSKVLASTVGARRSTKQKSMATSIKEIVSIPSTRLSKRQSVLYASKEGSEDPLSVSPQQAQGLTHKSGLLFQSMAFAVSYVRNMKEREDVTKLILENGGHILEDGFDSLFEPILEDCNGIHDEKIILSSNGKSLRFAAVIADEYSRKAKYLQALALGLPCISGRWIQNCVSKAIVIDWSLFLLCAGQSSVLGNACRSRTMQFYSAPDAKLSQTLAERKKIFEGKSVLLIVGKGKAREKRKAFTFLTQALGPNRVRYVCDNSDARKFLLEDEAQGKTWDLLHVHDKAKKVEAEIFGSGRKRKNIDGSDDENTIHCPRKVRVITDEIFIQSLIFGDLIEE
ncbi:Bgt-1367 [Blumeria graminis f. sp. tritici]|uniref:Bgt-1367 n=4 Tax=Blumeria graminis f. sp. tritici TaxID=62690 RepID=A0A9X9PRC6_BLUGR|nr:Bgt-1367 [Blumeria graminis f. sp. tritici]